MSDTLLRRIRRFRAQLPPHVAERSATKLLMEAKGEIERLNAIVDKRGTSNTVLMRSHAEFVAARCPDGEAVAMDMVHMADELATLRQIVNEVITLRAIVAKLPKCWRLVDGKRVQDVPVGLGMVVWWICNGIAWRGRVLGIEEHRLRVMSKDSPNGPCRSAPAVNFCCDTREAAEARGDDAQKRSNRES